MYSMMTVTAGPHRWRPTAQQTKEAPSRELCSGGRGGGDCGRDGGRCGARVDVLTSKMEGNAKPGLHCKT